MVSRNDPDGHGQPGHDSGDADTGLLDLLQVLDVLKVELVRHGGFVGLRGRHVGRLPGELWHLIDWQERALLRHVKNSPSPYRERQQTRRSRGT
jgi:hypothetical protein